ncbi:MAG: hypothetical protein ACR2GY_12570 [Phycisphaerales bacterium]
MFFKLIMNDEIRWINLSQVSRVTLGKEAPRGEPFAVITFADGCPETRLAIHACDAISRAAIDALVEAMESLTRSAWGGRVRELIADVLRRSKRVHQWIMRMTTGYNRVAKAGVTQW